MLSCRSRRNDWLVTSGQFESGGSKVYVGDDITAHRPGLDLLGEADEEKHLEGLLVDKPLVEPAMFIQEEAPATSVVDDGVVGRASLV